MFTLGGATLMFVGVLGVQLLFLIIGREGNVHNEESPRYACSLSAPALLWPLPVVRGGSRGVDRCRRGPNREYECEVLYKTAIACALRLARLTYIDSKCINAHNFHLMAFTTQVRRRCVWHVFRLLARLLAGADSRSLVRVCVMGGRMGLLRRPTKRCASMCCVS